ncbi:MAG: IS5 family transposase [Holophagaceae bacterium]
MTPKAQPKTHEQPFWGWSLEAVLDPRQELFRLAAVIDWASLERDFGGLYCPDNGRPGVPIRLMAGLHLLKHTFGLSDDDVVKQWVVNPYYQYFCGEEFFQHELPIDPSQMTRWRKRIGEAGCEKLLALTIESGKRTKTVTERSFEKVIVDTTVQPKAVAHPTDTRLYYKALVNLVRVAKREGVDLRQSYTRVSRVAFLKHGRHMKAKQFIRARKQQKVIKLAAGRVMRELERKLSDEAYAEHRGLMLLTELLLSQKRKTKGKVYSLHAPEVECIAKGKAHRPYEFGVKVSLATTLKEGFVVGIQACPGNPHDAHTLECQLDQVEALTGRVPRRTFVDQGYKGHGVAAERSHVLISRTRNLPKALKLELRRRSAIEPEIGHMKADGLLGRNHLKGMAGDAMHALLCGAGHNLRKILARIRVLLSLTLGEAKVRLQALMDRLEAFTRSQPLPAAA